METRARRSLSDMRERPRFAMKFCSLCSSMMCLKRFSLELMHSILITPISGSLDCMHILTAQATRSTQAWCIGAFCRTKGEKIAVAHQPTLSRCACHRPDQASVQILDQTCKQQAWDWKQQASDWKQQAWDWSAAGMGLEAGGMQCRLCMMCHVHRVSCLT